jgi:hypothetical protein
MSSNKWGEGIVLSISGLSRDDRYKVSRYIEEAGGK